MSLSLCLVGWVMSPPHSDPMSQRSHVSEIATIRVYFKGGRIGRQQIDRQLFETSLFRHQREPLALPHRQGLPNITNVKNASFFDFLISGEELSLRIVCRCTAFGQGPSGANSPALRTPKLPNAWGHKDSQTFQTDDLLKSDLVVFWLWCDAYFRLYNIKEFKSSGLNVGLDPASALFPSVGVKGRSLTVSTEEL